MEVSVRKVVSFFSILAILGVLTPASQAYAAVRTMSVPSITERALYTRLAGSGSQTDSTPSSSGGQAGSPQAGENAISGQNTTAPSPSGTPGQSGAASDPTTSANLSGGSNGGATSGSGGAGGASQAGGSVQSGTTSSTANVFNIVNRVVVNITIARR